MKYQTKDVVIFAEGVSATVQPFQFFDGEFIYNLGGNTRVKESSMGRLVSGPTVDYAYYLNAEYNLSRIDFGNDYYTNIFEGTEEYQEHLKGVIDAFDPDPAVTARNLYNRGYKKD